VEIVTRVDQGFPDAAVGLPRHRVPTLTASFESVFTEHRQPLIRALSVAINDESLATEAVDEAFTRALHRWHLVGAFDNPQAWIYRTAHNWATSRFRRLRRDRDYAPVIATADSATDHLPDPELTRALAGLPADQRNVLVLRYFLDWSISAIADALDVSEGTVKSRTHRALTQLNRQLGENP